MKINFINSFLLSTVNSILLLVLIFVITFFGVYLYRTMSVKASIVANPNYRSMHTSLIPTGGGIVFSSIFFICLIFLWGLNRLPNDIFIVLGVGGVLSAFFGFMDDIFEIGVKHKIFAQLLLASWVIFWFEGGPLLRVEWIPSLMAILITIFFLVWVINAYNFIDGVDGMAISGSIFISGSIALIMLITNGSSVIFLFSILLLGCSAAFAVFNWPPASIFMGDAGSLFFGYIYGALIIYTIMHEQINVYTWIIILSYFIADTTATQISRLLLLKKWNKAHRSHAYQNIAKITDSHLKTTLGVIFYNIFWVLPLLIWSIKDPNVVSIVITISMLPAFVVSFKYGPFLLSD